MNTTTNRRVDFPPGTRVLRHGDDIPGTVIEQPPGERVVVWWDSGTRSKHSIRQLRRVAS